jgi:uncharacterized protein YyaL (SSP411 family)
MRSRRTAWREGRLLATRKGDRAHLNAYLDDYAFPARGAHRAHADAISARDYEWARGSPTCCSRSSKDPKDGGFFFTSHDHEQLFHRTKPGHDNATPSGNAVAAGALIVLGHLCRRAALRRVRERAVRLYAPAMARSPAGFSTMLAAEAGRARLPPTSVAARAATRNSAGAGTRRSPPGSVPTFEFSTWRGRPAARPRQGHGSGRRRSRLGLPRHAVPAGDHDPGRLEETLANTLASGRW